MQRRAKRVCGFALVLLGACGGKAATYDYARSARTGGDSGVEVLPASGASHGGASSVGQSGSAGDGPVHRGGEDGVANVGGAANGGTANGGSATSAGQGGASSGAGGTLGASGSAGTSAAGGIAGVGATAGASGSGAAGGAPGSSKACASVTECPRPANACLVAHCTAGSCTTSSAPAGPTYVLDAPADCHATTACDGSGHATLTVDQSNTAIPSNDCLVGTCNLTGTVGSEPLPSGTPCHADEGGGRCDGQGACVACLVTADCVLGQTCNAHQQCVGQACSNLHCGGACPACPPTCANDQDCASNACDSTTLRCLADQQCADGQQNGNETDTDCGGGVCSSCAEGKACLKNADCASFACDAISFKCVADACSDHRMDGDESDVDCGGTNPACSLCGVGKKCYSNFDCVGGHFCPQTPKVCH